MAPAPATPVVTSATRFDVALPRPYLIFVGDNDDPVAGKTALGVARWAPHHCAGQWRTSPDALDVGLPELVPGAAVAAGARSLLIGVAPRGGALPADWAAFVVEAIEAGLDVVSGLHERLADHPLIAAAAATHRRTLHDIRTRPARIALATGRRRTGKRLLTVGTDCALGKKYTALAIAAALHARGIAVTFRATGQTGIMISGAGIAIDAVVADFIAGAAEALSPDAEPDHWDVIEGQGAITHPAYAGVTLGLVHGSQPDAMVLCHDPTRTDVAGFPGFRLPTFEEAIEAYVASARRTNPAARFVGVSLNTGGMEAPAAEKAIRLAEDRTGLPAFDPLRSGLSRFVDGLLA